MKKSIIFSSVFSLLIGSSAFAAEVLTVEDGLIDQAQEYGHHNSQDATIGFISDSVQNATVNVIWSEIIQTQNYGHHNTQEAIVGFAGPYSNKAEVTVTSGAIYQDQNGGYKNTQTAKIGVVH